MLLVKQHLLYYSSIAQSSFNRYSCQKRENQPTNQPKSEARLPLARGVTLRPHMIPLSLTDLVSLLQNEKIHIILTDSMSLLQNEKIHIILTDSVRLLQIETIPVHNLMSLANTYSCIFVSLLVKPAWLGKPTLTRDNV